MRDFKSRLREVVQRESLKRPQAAGRELTYAAELGGAPPDAATTAERLGGNVHTVSGSSCVVVDRVFDATMSHGRHRVESYAIDPTWPVSIFDSRLNGLTEWASRVVFFDIETTGLSGGAGMLAFLAGCGWFEDGSFRVRQFFLNGPGGEHAMLDALTRMFDDASLLVTFNGRTFDVPVMDMRWAFHRRDTPTGDLPHFDLLHPARRLWARRADAESCNLTSLERSILGFHRFNDVGGFDIPVRYFQFLRTGDTTLVDGVLEHNRHDIMSTAAVMARAMRIAAGDPEECREACEQLALGHLAEQRGESVRAMRAYELASASDDDEIRTRALERMAVLLRRASRYRDAADAWSRVIDLSESRRRPLTRLERRAAEALAIHHEHRAKNLKTAKRYAEAIRETTSARETEAIEHRLMRLERKLQIALLDEQARPLSLFPDS